MVGEHGHRRPLANCTMRSHIVVILAPKFDLCPGVVKIQEPMLVQAFKTNASVEAFDEGIVSGFSRSAEVLERSLFCLFIVKMGYEVAQTLSTALTGPSLGGCADPQTTISW